MRGRVFLKRFKVFGKHKFFFIAKLFPNCLSRYFTQMVETGGCLFHKRSVWIEISISKDKRGINLVSCQRHEWSSYFKPVDRKAPHIACNAGVLIGSAS